MFNSASGDVWEVEPWYLANSNSPKNGQIQAIGYVTDLTWAAMNGQLAGSYAHTIPYDWNYTPFHLGTGLDLPSIRPLRKPLPLIDFVADYNFRPGVIAYWFEVDQYQLAPAYGYLLKRLLDQLKIGKKLVKPRGYRPPITASEPQFIAYLGCDLALIQARGQTLLVQIHTDIETWEAGGFDEAIPMADQLLFVNTTKFNAVHILGIP